MKTVVGVCFLLALGDTVGCAYHRSDPEFYRPVVVKQQTENVYSFAPAQRPTPRYVYLATSVVWQEFARWSEKHKKKYRVLSVCPAYGSYLIVTVEDISPPAMPPELLPDNKKK